VPTYRPDGVLVLEVTFLVGTTPTDPAALTLTVRAPDGTSTEYVYLTDPEIVRDSAGVFHADIPAPLSGPWAWRWEGTGAAAGVDEGVYYVERSLIVAPGLCSLDDIKLARQDVTGGARDELMEALIARASVLIERVAHHQFTIDAAATDRFFPIVPTPERIVRIDDLSATPTEVQVLDEDGAGVYTAVVATDVVTRPRNRRSHEPIRSLRLRSAVPMSASYELRVRGVWGWPAVPDDIREACIETVIDWMKNHQGLTAQSPDQFDPGGLAQRALPLKAYQIARDYRPIPIA